MIAAPRKCHSDRKRFKSNLARAVKAASIGNWRVTAAALYKAWRYAPNIYRWRTMRLVYAYRLLYWRKFETYLPLTHAETINLVREEMGAKLWAMTGAD